MKRALISASLCALLAACGGNPLDPLPGGGGSGGGSGNGGADGDAEDTCGSTNVVCRGEVNLFTYDSGTNTISINNLPFDLDGDYSFVGTVNGFSQFINDNGDEIYVALYREGTEGTGAGVVATDGYANFGYGGVVLRSDGATLPSNGEATFSGQYAGIRVTSGVSGTTVAPDFTRVTGTANMRVDFEDFDVVGAIDGVIINRVAIDETNFPTALPSVSITTTGFDGIQIETTSAAEVVGPDQSGASGTFFGIFGGNVGAGTAEIAGIIILQGANFLNDDYDVLERGGFIAPQTSFTPAP
jgi:hypothetical protein